jgi:hypothetical protein
MSCSTLAESKQRRTQPLHARLWTHGYVVHAMCVSAMTAIVQPTGSPVAVRDSEWHLSTEKQLLHQRSNIRHPDVEKVGS